MQEKIHVVCNISNSYVKYCSVMLLSLCENNKGNHLVIHIVASGFSDEDKDVMRQNLEMYSVEFCFYSPNVELQKVFPPSDRVFISIIAYYKCFLADILPETLDKVLYLDGDMIVRANIQYLWNTDVSSYALACVKDMWCEDKANYERLEYPIEYSYFNSGVMLINLDFWRKNNVAQRAYDYLVKSGRKLRYFDQDILNALLYDKKFFLSFEWNMQDGFFKYKCRMNAGDRLEIDKLVDKPKIVHFTGRKKPWEYRALHPCRSEFIKYLDMSKWAGERAPFEIKVFLEKKINAVLYFFRILNPKYRKVKLK